jgi:hypothetical protein
MTGHLFTTRHLILEEFEVMGFLISKTASKLTFSVLGTHIGEFRRHNGMATITTSYGWDKLLASNKKTYLAGRCILRTTHAQNSCRSIKHDEPWRPPSYHGRHGAPPLAPRHRDISQHVIQQGCVIKTSTCYL